MKYFIILPIVFFLQKTALSQNVFKLDDVYGFKEYKFNTSPDKYSNIKLKGKGIYEEDIYSVGLSNDEYLGNRKIQGIELYFIDNMLVKIEVSIVPELEFLRSVFGKESSNDESEYGNCKTSYREWQGKYVSMYYYSSFGGYEFGLTSCSGAHLVFHLNNYTEIAQKNKAKKYKEMSGDFGEAINVAPKIVQDKKVHEIQLIYKSGVYEIPVVINGVLTLNLILDSGASEVFISEDIVSTLIKTGTIQNSDWLPSQEYQFASGEIVQSDRFTIKTIQLGTLALTNVEAAISNSRNTPLLLGQSVLNKLGKYSIDYTRNLLIIETDN